MRTPSSGCPGAHHGPLTRWSPVRPRHNSLAAATFIISLIGLFVSAVAFPENSQPVVDVMSIDRMIDPVVARFMTRGISEANDDGASLLVIELGGYGGSVQAIDRVSRAISDSPVPVALYVDQGGASVGPAATRLMETSRIAATAATASGAPVEVISADLPDLLKKLNGRVVTVRGTQVRLQTEGATVKHLSMSGAADLFSGLLSPDNAYLLLILGILGLLLELPIPGARIPGLVGTVSLIASISAFILLSVNPVGLAVIILGVVLFVADVKVASHGAVAVFGIAGILSGSFLLFQGSPGSTVGDVALRVSPVTIIVTTFVLSTILIFIIFKGVGAQRQKVVTGPASLFGDEGTALDDFRPVDDRRDGLSLSGTVRVGGEEWSAVSMGETIRSGDEVIVVAAEGIHLVVVKRN